MNGLKASIGHYLNDEFTSSEIEILWNKLVSYIKSNSSSFSHIRYIKDENIIKIKYNNENEILSIINKIDPNRILERYIVRTIKLNLSFDKYTKYLKLSNNNIEDFTDYNEVIYSLTCSKKLNISDSLFFHESSLIDYTNDFNIDKWNNCKYRLFCLFYDVNVSMLNEMNDVENISFSEKSFLCYDITINKLVNDSFYDSINNNSCLDLNNFINSFNEKTEFNFLNRIIKEDKITKIINISNIKYAISSFRMLDADPYKFNNFKLFINKSIYDSFINNLIRKSISI